MESTVPLYIWDGDDDLDLDLDSIRPAFGQGAETVVCY